MKGDPTPVCRYCDEYTPDWGQYVEAIQRWVCHTCMPKSGAPSNRDLRAAIESIRMAI